MATKLDKAQRMLSALDTLMENPAYKALSEDLDEDLNGTLQSVVGEQLEDSRRTWQAGYAVGLSQLGYKLQQMKKSAQREIDKAREADNAG